MYMTQIALGVDIKIMRKALKLYFTMPVESFFKAIYLEQEKALKNPNIKSFNKILKEYPNWKIKDVEWVEEGIKIDFLGSNK